MSGRCDRFLSLFFPQPEFSPWWTGGTGSLYPESGSSLLSVSYGHVYTTVLPERLRLLSGLLCRRRKQRNLRRGSSLTQSVLGPSVNDLSVRDHKITPLISVTQTLTFSSCPETSGGSGLGE